MVDIVNYALQYYFNNAIEIYRKKYNITRLDSINIFTH